MIINNKKIFSLLVLTLAAFCSVFDVSAQRRDHLTEQEVELVRDAQQIDLRMKVFVKAIDRRFLALKPDASQAKQIEKDSEFWGDLPTGTRLQLLSDIEKLLDEAISKIDDVAARDMKSEFFPKAVRILADGASRFLPRLKIQVEQAADEKERGTILNAVELCNQIIAASGKVPKEDSKTDKKKKSKDDSN